MLTLAVAYSALGIVKQITSDVWHSETKVNPATVTTLQARIQKYKRWDNLLQDRSKAWVCMELLNRLVPEDGSVVLTDVRHQIEFKQLSRDKNKIGLQKRWMIQGTTTETGLSMLEDFNAIDGKKIKQIFTDVALATQNEAYLLSVGERDISVNFTHKIKAGGRVSKEADSDPSKKMSHSFNLTITQTFSDKDPIMVSNIKK